MADKHPAYSPANRPDTQEPEQLLREFHTVYNVPEGEDLSLYPGELPQLPARRRFTLRKAILTAAAAACLILLLVCTTVGFDTVFQMIGVWTPEQLTFENQYDGEISDMEPTPTQPEEDAAYASLQEAVGAYGITAPVVPPYIPEGFTDPLLHVSTAILDRVSFAAFYEKGDDWLVIDIMAWNEPGSSTFEKDDSEVVEYVKGGITHYLYNNLDASCAAWFNGNLECMIATSLPRSEVTAMIDSLYS